MTYKHGSRLPLLIFSIVALASPAAAATSFRIVSTVDLPERGIARDVRWAGQSEAYVSAGKEGVLRVRVDSAAGAKAVTPPADRGGLPLSGLVAVGQNHLVVASQMMRTVAWTPLEDPANETAQKTLLSIMDVDARGDTAAILGADSGPLQGLARDGTIAWIGSLSKDLADMRPIMKGRSDPGGKDMARCSIFETGAIRFMQDGSLVVVPGVEPGVYRYSASGKLMQTWDTEALGIVDDCSMDEEEQLLLARDPGERRKWRASRVVLDEILPMPDGPGLVLRRVENGVTKWDLVTLPYRGGKPERTVLPVSMPTPGARVRGDVRGDRIVLLLFEDLLPGQKPVGTRKLVVLSIGRK